MEINNTNKCVVCGNQSNGVHYNAVTCEPCKVFFKRTVQAKKVYNCKSKIKRNCPMSVRGRASCSFCRFFQCLNNGMKIEMVRENRKRGNTFKLLKDKIRQDKTVIDIDYILEKWKKENEISSVEKQAESLSDYDTYSQEKKNTEQNKMECKPSALGENYVEYPESFVSSENNQSSYDESLQTKLEFYMYNKNPEYNWDREFFQVELNPFQNSINKSFDSRVKEPIWWPNDFESFCKS